MFNELVVYPYRIQSAATIAASLICASGLLWAFNATYTKTIAVQGWIESESPPTRVYASIGGKVSSVFVAEGIQVDAGEELVMIEPVPDRQGNGEMSAAQVGNLDERLAILSNQHETEINLLESTIDALRLRSSQNSVSSGLLSEQLSLASEKVELSERNHSRVVDLVAQGVVPKASEDDSYRSLVDAKLAATQLKVQISQFAEDGSVLAEQITSTQNQIAQANLDYEERRKTLEYLRRAETAAIIVPVSAPHAGLVENLSVSEGGLIRRDDALLTLLRPDQSYRIRLFLPAAAAGLVETGQNVSIALHSYPYQTFGRMHAKIVDVSSVVSFRQELLDSPISSTGPGFLASAEILEPVVEQSKKRTLKSGMTLDAEVQTETRSVIGWLVGPVLELFQ
ncbi:MAG: HlyD family efflux transporter periplasmic adaptor subunit [Pseudomonadota bacterium]